MESTCVLLSSYNGERYIREQLDSLIEQENASFDIIIRDDGSCDATISIIEEYVQRYSNIKLIDSDGNVGVAKSFMALLNYAIDQGYERFFFCDQDDVWMKDKCRRAMERVDSSGKPALYFSKKEIVDSDLNKIPVEDIVHFSDSFWDIFTQSNAFGCTMCFNRCFAQRVVMNDFDSKTYLHDAYIYRLALVTDATIVFDEQETIRYRQHSNNVAGSVKKGIVKRLNKKARRSRKHYMKYLASDLLKYNANDISSEYKSVLSLVCRYDSEFKARCSLIKRVLLSDADTSTRWKLIIKIAANLL